MKNKYQTVFFFIFIYLIYMTLSVNHLFIKLRIPVMTPPFADLRLITSTAECLQKDPLWSLQSSSCDPWNRPFNLPTLWAKLFAALDLTESKTNFIGYIFILMFSLAAAYWFHQFVQSNHLSGIYRAAAIGVLFALFISPPVLLLLERGNVDVLIFIGITFSVHLLRKRRFLAALLLTLLGGLKLFPWAGLLFMLRSKFSKISILAICSILFFLGLHLAPELSLIKSRSITDFNGISFGVSMVPEFILTRFNHFEAFTLAHTLGSLGFLFLMMAYGHILPKFRHLDIQECVTEIKSDRVSEESFLIVASVFLGTYLVGTSYDYRLVFIIPLLISLSQFLKSNVQNLALGAFGLLILYDSYWFKPTVGIISDLALLAFAPLVAYLLYKLIRVDFEHNRYRQ